MVEGTPLVELLTEPNKETEEEAKLTKKVFATAVETKDELDEILEKKQLLEDSPGDSVDQKISQQLQAEQLVGPLTTVETDK